jgi:hypothetical protein
MLATLQTDNPHTRNASCSSSAAMQSAFSLGADALPTPPATMPTPPNQLPAHIDASTAKKRKRTDSEEPRVQLASKRPRVSDDAKQTATNNSRGSARSTPIPTTGRKHKVPLPVALPVPPPVRVNVIPRPCTANADGTVENLVSCFDIVKRNVNNFKQCMSACLSSYSSFSFVSSQRFAHPIDSPSLTSRAQSLPTLATSMISHGLQNTSLSYGLSILTLARVRGQSRLGAGLPGRSLIITQVPSARAQGSRPLASHPATY